MADKGEVPPSLIDDSHDVKNHVASNLSDDKELAGGESRSRDIPVGSMTIQDQTEKGSSIGIALVETSGSEKGQLAPSDAVGQGPEHSILSSSSHNTSSSVIDSGIAQETAEKDGPQEVTLETRDNLQSSEQHDQHALTAQSSLGSGEFSDIPAVGASVLAAGSVLVAPAVVEAADTHSQGDIQSSQDSVVRDISEGIPSERSAHDLPPRSPSPALDAATTVESSKSPIAGSQYGSITSDQQAAQAVQSHELRERYAASAAESSARSSKQDVVVKDEVLAKPSAVSTTPGKLTILASMALGAYAVFKLANGAWGSRYP